MQRDALIVWILYFLLEIVKIHSLQPAVLKLTVYDNVNGKFRVQKEFHESKNIELGGYYSPAGPFSSVEGAIYQIHPAVCTTKQRLIPSSGYYNGLGWIAYTKLEAGSEFSECDVFTRANQAFERGAKGMIFDVSDAEIEANRLLGASPMLREPVIIIKGKQAHVFNEQVAVSQFASMPGDDNNVSQVAHCRIILQNVNVPTSRDGGGGVNSSVMLSAIVVACLCFVILIVVAILACKCYLMEPRQMTLEEHTKRHLRHMKTRRYQRDDEASTCDVTAAARSPLRCGSILSGLTSESTAVEICAICISAYKQNEELRVLPCCHEFHKTCVDPWLIKHRTCPLCITNIMDSRRSSLKSNSHHLHNNNIHTGTVTSHHNSSLTSHHNIRGHSNDNSAYPTYAYEQLPQLDAFSYMQQSAATNTTHLQNLYQHAYAGQADYDAAHSSMLPVFVQSSIGQPFYAHNFDTSPGDAASPYHVMPQLQYTPTAHCNRQLGSVTSPAYLPKTAASNATPLRCKQQTRCKRLHRKLPARSLRISLSSESDIEFARSWRSTAARSQRSSTHARAHLPELRHHTDADVSETSGGDVESDTALRQSSAHALSSTAMTPHNMVSDSSVPLTSHTVGISRMSLSASKPMTSLSPSIVAASSSAFTRFSDSSLDTNQSRYGTSATPTVSDSCASSSERRHVTSSKSHVSSSQAPHTSQLQPTMHLQSHSPDSITVNEHLASVTLLPKCLVDSNYSLDNSAFSVSEAFAGVHSTVGEACVGVHSTVGEACVGVHSTVGEASTGVHSTVGEASAGVHSTVGEASAGVHSTTTAAGLSLECNNNTMTSSAGRCNFPLQHPPASDVTTTCSKVFPTAPMFSFASIAKLRQPASWVDVSRSVNPSLLSVPGSVPKRKLLIDYTDSDSSLASVETMAISPLVSDFPLSSNSDPESNDITALNGGFVANAQAGLGLMTSAQHVDPTSMACSDVLEQESLLRIESDAESLFSSRERPKRCRLDADVTSSGDVRRPNKRKALGFRQAVSSKTAFRAYRLRQASLQHRTTDMHDLSARQASPQHRPTDMQELSVRLQALSNAVAAHEPATVTSSDNCSRTRAAHEPATVTSSDNRSRTRAAHEPATVTSSDNRSRTRAAHESATVYLTRAEQCALQASNVPPTRLTHTAIPPVPPRRTVSLHDTKQVLVNNTHVTNRWSDACKASHSDVTGHWRGTTCKTSHSDVTGQWSGVSEPCHTAAMTNSSMVIFSDDGFVTVPVKTSSANGHVVTSHYD